VREESNSEKLTMVLILHPKMGNRKMTTQSCENDAITSPQTRDYI